MPRDSLRLLVGLWIFARCYVLADRRKIAALFVFSYVVFGYALIASTSKAKRQHGCWRYRVCFGERFTTAFCTAQPRWRPPDSSCNPPQPFEREFAKLNPLRSFAKSCHCHLHRPKSSHSQE